MRSLGRKVSVNQALDGHILRGVKVSRELFFVLMRVASLRSLRMAMSL